MDGKVLSAAEPGLGGCILGTGAEGAGGRGRGDSCYASRRRGGTMSGCRREVVAMR
jgi:hypothetical protein